MPRDCAHGARAMDRTRPSACAGSGNHAVSSYQSTSVALPVSAGSVSKSRAGSSSPSQRPSRETASRARAWQASRPAAASRSGCKACSSVTSPAITVSKPSRTCGIVSARHCVPRGGSLHRRTQRQQRLLQWSTGSCSADCAPDAARFGQAVAAQLLPRAHAEAFAEELRGQFRQLMRLVDDEACAPVTTRQSRPASVPGRPTADGG